MNVTNILNSSSCVSSVPDAMICPPIAARCGWVPQYNGRGTTDIIWSCACALFLCLWVMLHLNVPAEDDSHWLFDPVYRERPYIQDAKVI